MNAIRLELLDQAQLATNFPKRFFELVKLGKSVEKQRTGAAPSLQKLVQPLMANVTKGQVSNWDPVALSQFLSEACQIVRLAIATDNDTRTEPPGSTSPQGQIELSSWLCSLAVARRVDPAVTLEVAATWIRGRLQSTGARELEDPIALLTQLTVTIAPMNLAEDILTRRARTEFVLYVGTLTSAMTPFPDAAGATARLWCSELIVFVPLQEGLTDAAKRLGVSLPENARLDKAPEKPARTFTPEILALPQTILPGALQAEWELCLMQLLGIPQDELLTEATLRRIRELTPETAHTEGALAITAVAWEIWNSYWTTGKPDDETMDAARHFAEFAYAVQRRQNMLQLIINFQLPKLIRVSALPPIRAEADPLFQTEGFTLTIPGLLMGMVQAVAGACRHADHNKDEEDRNVLLTLHGQELLQIHKEYERLSRERNTPETEAWIYLGPFIVAADAPKVDATLVSLVNRGNHGDVERYLQAHLEQTINALERKLTRHRLSDQHLLRPKGRITNPQGQSRGQLLPSFETAIRLLDANEFERAATEFEDLATNRRIPNHQQMIARDYQAYALARWGRNIQAKPLLRRLCDDSYRFSSAYWNRACVETERVDQISVLVQGLERAADPSMLEAVVYLSVILDRKSDAQVCRWLSLLPFREALMLQYLFEAARVEESDDGRRRRDDLLKRISAYIDHSDPYVPNPTEAKIPLENISDLRDSLKQRDHLEVLGFWLQCYGSSGISFKDSKARGDYYKLRTDIWDELGQPRESAASFQDEMDSHLGFLEYLGRDKGAKGVPARLVHDIRSRLEKQLRSCMAPGLEALGKQLYRTVQEWEIRIAKGDLRLILDGPPQRKIHEFYGGGAETLDRILLRVSSDLRKNFHDLRGYDRQRAGLADLLRALDAVSKPRCAAALRDQQEKWDRISGMEVSEDRNAVAAEARDAFASLEAAFEQELSPEQLEMANGIFHAFKRVNARHVPGPKLEVTAVEEAAPAFRGHGQISAFGVRVSIQKGSREARVTQAVARLQDSGHSFALRDDLNTVPVVVREDRSILLTFEDDGKVEITGDCDVDVVIAYEYSGETFETPSLRVTLRTAERAKVSVQNPYIYAREMYPEEIEGRFFGRDKEERTIMGLLAGPPGRIGYIEGIRKSGKTSLFNSLRHRVAVDPSLADSGGSRLVLVHIKGGTVSAFSQVGQILQHFLSEICLEPQIAAAGVVPPDEAACCTNMMSAYRTFEAQLRSHLPGHRIVAFWDDFQTIVDLAEELGFQNQAFLVATRALLDVIRERRDANSPLIWLLAGFRFWMRFITQLPRVNLWAELERIPIDFLDADAVRDILVMPLSGTPMAVTPEVVFRVCEYTQGHPEVVQRMGALMLSKAQGETRCAITPADADSAAREIGETAGLFADTWCQLSEFSEVQRTLVGSFINVVKQVGGRIEPHRLVGAGAYGETERKEVESLVARKILARYENGTQIGIKAPVLEMWMRNHWKDVEPPLTAAVFLDLANLTQGTGNDVLEFSGVSVGDVVAGTFKLKTVLDAIDGYAADLVPTPVTEKWAINYPPGSRATPILNLNFYQVKNIDKSLFEKGARSQAGSDDVTLMSKIAEITADRPAITHVVLVTGDKDLKMVGVDLQLKRGKSVHILTRRESAANDLLRLAQHYPQKCKLVFLEDLLAGRVPKRG